MKRFFTVLGAACLLFWGCSGSQVPAHYQQQVTQAISRAGGNAAQLQRALKEVPADQAEGMAFLIANMPERDLQELQADFLLENVRLAYEARQQFTWAKNLPDSIFLNEVLPYASLNERRDNWRADFLQRLTPVVAQAKDVHQAIALVNDTLQHLVKVKYSTARKKPDQSPYESMEQGLASCSGLSILLTDAFRAVGIPSRIAGTPNWTTKEGNHNWNEVWVDGKWYFTEYYPSGLDKSWFLADAGKADASQPKHWIYASSFKSSQAHFPLVWDSTITYVHAENVTQRYLDLYRAEQAEQQARAEGKVRVDLVMFRTEGCSVGDDRVARDITVKVDGKEVAKGRTSGPEQDMNDFFSLQLKEGTAFSVHYLDQQGRPKQVDLKASAQQAQHRLYMQ